jgi:NAD(P)-dependent dehydrogenase (short-subunit alcohol dehydrogenase family)
MDGKVILVTGGASGIGAAAVTRFREVGATVFVSDVRDPEDLSADLFVEHDVASPEGWDHVLTRIRERSGRLDGLVNSAGIFRAGMIADIELDTWHQLLAVNQTGILLGMRACIELLSEDGGGSIVNLSSYAGMQGHGTSVAYQATKWAVRGMTRFAAREFASRGVRVNALAPGFIDTPMVRAGPPELIESINARVPLRRLGTAAETAEAIRFLISDESAYITGVELPIDGGLLA